jgi:hypothetical protein
MEKRSFFSGLGALLLSPPVLVAFAVAADICKLHFRAGMTFFPETIALMAYVAVSLAVLVFWVIRCRGRQKEPRSNDDDSQNFQGPVVLSRFVAGIFIGWIVFSLHYAMGLGSGFIYSRDAQGGGVMVSSGWSAVRLREKPDGPILSVRSRGVFVKPCVSGCVEAVGVNSAMIEEQVAVPSPHGTTSIVTLRALMRIETDEDGFTDLALRVNDVQEELEVRARSALRKCAQSAFASGGSVSGARPEIACGQDSKMFSLVSPAING